MWALSIINVQARSGGSGYARSSARRLTCSIYYAVTQLVMDAADVQAPQSNSAFSHTALADTVKIYTDSSTPALLVGTFSSTACV